MQPVTITLNQRLVSGHAGMTILEIARESGIEIPTLCNDPNLKPVGACRLCLVENEETGALLASCVTEVVSGMAINTNSPRVLEHRKMIVKLLLASHPDACLICDKGNRCSLRQIASELGIGQIELERIPQYARFEELNPFILKDTTKCVLCGKCIRACHEIVVEGVLDYYRRGFLTKPATFNDLPLEQSECTFCGTCLAICPTGALMEKEKPYQGTTRLSIETVCAYCSCGCPITLEVKGNRIVRSLPADGSITNHGALCIRGSYGYDYIHSRDRLTAPLMKANGNFKEVTWDEALAFVASSFEKIRKQHGAESLAVYGSSRCTNEENYLLQRFARTVLGTNNIDHGSSFHNSVIRSGLGGNIGCLSTTNSLEALEQAELILVVGVDPTVVTPQVGYTIKRAVRHNGAKLILIEPRHTGLTFYASQRLSPKPSGTTALINSISQSIIEDKLINPEYVSRQTEDFESFAEMLAGCSPGSVREITGISGDQIRDIARSYAGVSKAAIVFGSAVTGAVDGVETVRSLYNLALLTDNLWCSGCGIYPLQRDNNAQGASEMGALPDYLPGCQPLSDQRVRDKFEHLWQNKIPDSAGIKMLEAFSQGQKIPFKALYIVGENPICSLPIARQVEAAFSKLDFLVVQDLFITETASYADVILPAASFAEKEGSYTNFEGRIGWLKRALTPFGDSLSDWEIFFRLAKVMDSQFPYSTLQQVIDEIEENVPLYEGYHQSEEHLGEKLSYWDERRALAFQSLGGFPRFLVSDQPVIPPKTATEYPYYLIMETVTPFFGSGSRSKRSWRLNSICPAAVLKINEKDAAILSIDSGTAVQVTSSQFSLKATAELSSALPAGTVSLPVSYPEANRLFEPDPKTGEPISLPEACYVRLERVSLGE